MISAIILARGGSKAIPKKNLIDFCGEPLLYWTVKQCMDCPEIDTTWVSSDSEEILSYAEKIGAQCIMRPEDISGDKATSESGWLHGIQYIESLGNKVDLVVAPQVTSPLRESADISNAIKQYYNEKLDSLFSSSPAGDLFMWNYDANRELVSLNYDYKNRKRKQDFESQMIENGSFYLFTKDVIEKNNNRLGGKIGASSMDFWKAFEIDHYDTKDMCEAIMQKFLIKNK